MRRFVTALTILALAGLSACAGVSAGTVNGSPVPSPGSYYNPVSGTTPGQH